MKKRQQKEDWNKSNAFIWGNKHDEEIISK